jgi:hypothetical protein
MKVHRTDVYSFPMNFGIHFRSIAITKKHRAVCFVNTGIFFVLIKKKLVIRSKHLNQDFVEGIYILQVGEYTEHNFCRKKPFELRRHLPLWFCVFFLFLFLFRFLQEIIGPNGGS